MQDIITWFGYPRAIVADKLLSISYKCKEYYKGKDIRIITCTPHCHQANGLSEKAVNICNQVPKNGAEEGSAIMVNIITHLKIQHQRFYIVAC